MEKIVINSKVLGELPTEGFSSYASLFLQKIFIICFSPFRKMLSLLQLRLTLYSELVRRNTRKRTHSAYVWEVIEPVAGFQKNDFNEIRKGGVR